MKRCASGGITPLLKRLEAAALVTRTRNPKDERQVIVTLTAKGRSLNERTTCLTDTLLERSGMTPEKLTKLNAQMQALKESLEQS